MAPNVKKTTKYTAIIVNIKIPMDLNIHETSNAFFTIASETTLESDLVIGCSCLAPHFAQKISPSCIAVPHCSQYSVYPY
jgi:hypothetical protein